ncbi:MULTISPECIES: hypothetical protein [Haloarcula]|uniref:hypothetical protein n=1 Tax=Haloarcula TaxID=2237 RepID=UPI000F8DF4B6|nr:MULTISPECIES: hypothetical protein [Haloarcula]NHX42003.1 hypothetical protein [Haloarcula sp. R1-2]
MDSDSMTTNAPRSGKPDGHDGIDARQYSQYANAGDNEAPILWAQLEGDGPQSTTMEGEAAVEVQGDAVKLTLTAEFSDAERLLDRDVLSVQLCGKDMPEEPAKPPESVPEADR